MCAYYANGSLQARLTHYLAYNYFKLLYLIRIARNTRIFKFLDNFGVNRLQIMRFNRLGSELRMSESDEITRWCTGIIHSNSTTTFFPIRIMAFKMNVNTIVIRFVKWNLRSVLISFVWNATHDSKHLRNTAFQSCVVIEPTELNALVKNNNRRATINDFMWWLMDSKRLYA